MLGTQHDIEKNVQVVYFESMNGDQVGNTVNQAVSCYYMKKSGKFIKVASYTPNDCLLWRDQYDTFRKRRL